MHHLGNLGNLALSQERLEEAYGNYLQVLTIAREVGDKDTEGIALANLGRLAFAKGQPEEARAYLEQALATLHEMQKPDRERIVQHLFDEMFGKTEPSQSQLKAKRRWWPFGR